MKYSEFSDYQLTSLDVTIITGRDSMNEICFLVRHHQPLSASSSLLLISMLWALHPKGILSCSLKVPPRHFQRRRNVPPIKQGITWLVEERIVTYHWGLVIFLFTSQIYVTVFKKFWHAFHKALAKFKVTERQTYMVGLKLVEMFL